MILDPKKIKSVSISIASLSICHEVMGLDDTILAFWMFSFKPTLSLSSFTIIKSFALSHKGCVIWVSEVVGIIPGNLDFSLEFYMMYSASKLNKKGDNIQPWCTPFPVWKQSVVPCPVLTVASWLACGFLRRQVRWSGILISWRIFYGLLWSTQGLWHS